MEYNPFSPEVQQYPYPYYAHLREHAPVYQVPQLGIWALSRYDDVLAAFRNPQVFSSSIYVTALTGELNPYSPEAPALVGSDPPVHTRLRKLVNRAFTSQRIASLEARVRELANELIESVANKREFDLVKEVAEPLPGTVIAEMLGVEPERQPDFRRWTEAIITSTKGAAVTAEERERIPRDLADVHAYFRAAIERCRKQPGNNLLSDLVRAEEENQALTSEEILNLAILLLVGGNETTTNMIGNGVLALLEHPEQLEQVRADPALAPNWVEETMRYDAPVQTSFRSTTQEVEIGGVKIPAGAMVILLIGSANRDERKFPDADRFNVTRSAEGHLGFAAGIHYCVGAQLARLEAKAALQALLGAFPRLSLKDKNTIPRVASVVVHGPTTLPLLVG